MRELLPDNIAMAERLAALPQGLAPSKPPGEREIAGDRALATWVSSFATYVAIVAQAHPERVGDMLAYLRLIVREASKFGGNGWLTYDTVFRRNRDGSSTPWNALDAALHQVYLANAAGKVVTPCKHCQEVDHQASECAVATLLPKSQQALQIPHPQQQTAPLPAKGNAPRPSLGSDQYASHGTPGTAGFLAYVHVCTGCYGPHPVSACKDRFFAPPPNKRPALSAADPRRD